MGLEKIQKKKDGNASSNKPFKPSAKKRPTRINFQKREITVKGCVSTKKSLSSES